MLKEVRFTFRHDGCWLQETTERHSGVMLVCSSVYNAATDVVMNLTVHTSDAGLVDRLHQEWDADDRIKQVRRLHEGPQGVRFHVSYNSPHSIFHHILEHTPVSIGAIRVGGGAEHYQIIGGTAEVQRLLQVLMEKGEVQVESIRDAGTVEDAAANTPWAELTDKQLEALVLAHLGGYYQWPRDRSASALAEQLGLSSSAFLDHLRHAEAKLVGGIMADLRAAEPGRIEALRARHRSNGPAFKVVA